MDHPLLSHPRALLSPHVAWYSEESEMELRRKAAHNVVSWTQTGRPDYVVVEGRCRSRPGRRGERLRG